MSADIQNNELITDKIVYYSKDTVQWFLSQDNQWIWTGIIVPIVIAIIIAIIQKRDKNVSRKGN